MVNKPRHLNCRFLTPQQHTRNNSKLVTMVKQHRNPWGLVSEDIILVIQQVIMSYTTSLIWNFKWIAEDTQGAQRTNETNCQLNSPLENSVLASWLYSSLGCVVLHKSTQDNIQLLPSPIYGIDTWLFSFIYDPISLSHYLSIQDLDMLPVPLVN